VKLEKLIKPEVSVVVPTKNCAGTISALLRSLQRQEFSDFEVIVVDSSNDDTKEIASKFSVKVISSDHQGLNLARDLGIQKSLGEIICFIDGDCRARPDWISRIISEFNKSPSIGCVGGRVIVDSSTFLGSYSNETLVSVYPNYTKPGSIEPNSKQLLDQPFTEPRFPVGCNMAFKRKALLELRGFDEKWKCGWDEFEIMYRLLNRGYSISVNPEIAVYHSPRSSIFEALCQAYRYGTGAGHFMRIFKIPIKRKVRLTLLGALRTVPHSIGVQRKTRKVTALLYPLMDILMGISYYIGVLRAFTQPHTNR